MSLPFAYNEKIILGTWSEERLDRHIADAAKIKNIGERIAFLSEQFLGTPYKKSPLIGAATIPERLVINTKNFDCFTFLDCIEAMRLSRTYDDFRKKLVRIRYKKGVVEYKRRNHFFTDWTIYNRDFVQDKTKKIGGSKTQIVKKTLNHKDDGASFVDGIRFLKRLIFYIPSEAVNKTMCRRLKTGDYVGIYTNLEGLDVSHVGIIVKDGSSIYFRHASSIIKKVVDQDFSEYISGKSGIIILRPY